jgi:hypothetical protein
MDIIYLYHGGTEGKVIKKSGGGDGVNLVREGEMFMFKFFQITCICTCVIIQHEFFVVQYVQLFRKCFCHGRTYLQHWKPEILFDAMHKTKDEAIRRFR